MKYEEIIKLLDAGYTREEIMEMKNAPADNEPDPAPDQEDPKPVSDITGEIMAEVKDMFAEMKKELTAMNIMNSRQEGEELKTGEDILANIINPTRKNGGN